MFLDTLAGTTHYFGDKCGESEHNCTCDINGAEDDIEHFKECPLAKVKEQITQ